MNDDDLSRFRAHCFQFACNKLDPEEAAWMQQMLLRHPALQAEVDADRELAARARQALESAVDTPPLVSFAQIQRALAEHQRSRRKTLGERLGQWWQQLTTTPASSRGRWALAAVAVLGVMVTLQTRQLLHNDAVVDNEYRALAPGVETTSGVLSVVFSETLALGDVRTKLDAMHMRIRSGPNANGAYEVVVISGSLQEAMQRLKDAGLAREVQVLDLRARARQ